MSGSEVRKSLASRLWIDQFIWKRMLSMFIRTRKRRKPHKKSPLPSCHKRYQLQLVGVSERRDGHWSPTDVVQMVIILQLMLTENVLPVLLAVSDLTRARLTTCVRTSPIGKSTLNQRLHMSAHRDVHTERYCWTPKDVILLSQDTEPEKANRDFRTSPVVLVKTRSPDVSWQLSRELSGETWAAP